MAEQVTAKTSTSAEEEVYEVETPKISDLVYEKTARKTTIELAEEMSKYFRSFLYCYEGCKIAFTRRDQFNNDFFDTYLVFTCNPRTPNTDGKINSVINLTSNADVKVDHSSSKIDYSKIINNFELRTKGKNFDLTEEVKKILLPFMNPVNGKSVTMKNIDNFISIYAQPMNNIMFPKGTEQYFIIVKNINLNYWIRKTRGTTMSIGEKPIGDGKECELVTSKCNYKLEFVDFMSFTNNQEAILKLITYSIDMVKELNVKENPALNYSGSSLSFH